MVWRFIQALFAGGCLFLVVGIARYLLHDLEIESSQPRLPSQRQSSPHDQQTHNPLDWYVIENVVHWAAWEPKDAGVVDAYEALEMSVTGITYVVDAPWRSVATFESDHSYDTVSATLLDCYEGLSIPCKWVKPQQLLVRIAVNYARVMHVPSGIFHDYYLGDPLGAIPDGITEVPSDFVWWGKNREW